MRERAHDGTVGIGEMADGWNISKRKARDMEKRPVESSGGA